MLPKGIKKNILLKNHTTFKIGGPARYFFVAKAAEELISAVKWAKENKIKFFVLAGGSNVLFSDKGYDGLIVKVQNPKSKCQNDLIYTDAGANLATVVKLAMEKGLAGMEWAAGIPGSVGGAVYGNAGAFGNTMADIVGEVECFDTKSLKLRKIKKAGCKFGNKDSIFKKNRNLIIWSIVLKLQKGNKEEIEKKVSENLAYRKKNHPIDMPSAGCAFKNCEVKIKNPQILAEFPIVEKFNEKGVVPTSFLVDKSGLKGKKIGKAMISGKHANFIVNMGGAKATDVLKLVALAKKKVKERFGVNLVEEIQVIK